MISNLVMPSQKEDKLTMGIFFQSFDSESHNEDRKEKLGFFSFVVGFLLSPVS
jgi:hypothetical protein